MNGDESWCMDGPVGDGWKRCRDKWLEGLWMDRVGERGRVGRVYGRWVGG